MAQLLPVYRCWYRWKPSGKWKLIKRDGEPVEFLVESDAVKYVEIYCRTLIWASGVVLPDGESPVPWPQRKNKH